MGIRSVEDTKGPYSEEEVVRDVNISMGNVEIKSNDHGVDMPKERDLEETMRSLKIELLR